jgi:hypothetical protein
MTTRQAQSDRYCEVLTRLSPTPVSYATLAKEVGTNSNGLAIILRSLDQRGYCTETVRENGELKVFASPAAWRQIREKAQRFWQQRYE